MIDLGKKREVFWDDYLVDTEKTTAFHTIIEPIKKEQVFLLDKGLENEAVSYPHILYDGEKYRMYYVSSGNREDKPLSYYSVIESEDGITWHRPALNICDVGEEGWSNVLMTVLDNAFTFIDTNPNCPAEEKYKTIAKEYIDDGNGGSCNALTCFVSADGYHMKRSHVMTNEGHFDTLNTAHYDGEKYVAYIRSFHDIIEGADINLAKRDVRVMYSTDFKQWTTPKLIEFYDGIDYPLYTNNVIPYERAPQIKLGFPTRYVERPDRLGSFKQLASRDVKENAAERLKNDRVARAVTDTIFMFSRNGEKWERYNQAFLRNGYENADNWIYGDGYPSYGFVDSGREVYYFYVDECHITPVAKPLYRYEIRKDGFACIMAGGDEAVVITKPLMFEGSQLHLNFSGTAYGYMYVDVLDENCNPISPESYEVYGDTIDRTVEFPDGSDFSAYAGKKVRLRFRMRDTKLFSMKFE